MKISKILGYISMIAGCWLITDSVSAQDSTKKDITPEKQVQQQNQERNREQHNFVDKDGDGYNDNAPDHDGDGIPNGLDPDYKVLQQQGQEDEFVDADGDGIDDRLVKQGKEKKLQKRQKKGQKSGLQPQDGTGKQQRKGKGR